ncbi:glycosyltransferase [Halochromatium glycolicum]|uniref:Glycosyl transferase family 1 n=1 Tax=Halochromatium glycolicum TaxID=85075 RepID=A0AAJ0U6U5_9GAMM|nr:glycosyltransferase [Halochromatium glycolicum]MBK1706403.1 glycosyl transferase family 1 [Halochromatium glycolicum]
MLRSSLPPGSTPSASAAEPAPLLDARDLRVAIVSDAAPERNGVGTYYSDLADHLKAVGAKVELISPRYRAGQWYGGLAMPMPGDPTQRFLVPRPKLITRRLARLSPNAIIIPTPGPYGMAGLMFAKRYGARLVVGFHTHFERLAALNSHWRLFGVLAQTYLNSCHRALFKASHLVLANSDEMLEVARSIGATNVGLMGTPIPKRFLDVPLTPLRPQLERVLFAGRLAPEKNLGAVAEAAEAVPQLQFQIAGDGPLREWVQQEAGRLPNLEYVGWVRRQQILPLIDNTDILVLPSTIESFGTIALEAMARARLVIVSSQCGILSWDLLNRGLFQMREDEPLSAVLERICALDRSILERKAALGRDAAREINRRNLEHWLSTLRGEEPRGLDHDAID